MITLEKVNTSREDEYGINLRTYVVINGIHDKDSYLFADGGRVSIENEEIIDILLNHSFKEVSEHFAVFTFDKAVDWWEGRFSVEAFCKESYNQNVPEIKIDLQLQDWEHWAQPWSMSDLAKGFESSIERLGDAKLQYWQDEPDSMLNGFGIQYFPDSLSLSIASELNTVLSILPSLIETTNKNLLASLDKDALLTYFQFPEEIKTACKQYLIYFTQFIADIGISVDTEIKEEANQTLFKVSPKDKNEGLERIREALHIYMNAPGANDFQIQVANYTDVAAKQWEANVYHLKSQLVLANSILQSNQATIESLQLSNYQYKQLLESKEHDKASNEEALVKGVVTVNKYEGKGFTINLAEILRRLKRRFTK